MGAAAAAGAVTDLADVAAGEAFGVDDAVAVVDDVVAGVAAAASGFFLSRVSVKNFLIACKRKS